jgi:hypothetical protein
LLAFSDSDLFQIVHLWVSREALSSSFEGYEDVLSALGYTLWKEESSAVLSNHRTEDEGRAGVQWLVPAPHHLRTLLEKMDIQSFSALVLPLAFEALHSTHPEWGEEGTFHAHLANYLRRMYREQHV